MNAFPVGTKVGVIDKDKPNYGLIGEVVLAFPKARKIPPGWVWVQFGGYGGDRWWCEYDPASLVSIPALGVAAFKKMLENDQ